MRVHGSHLTPDAGLYAAAAAERANAAQRAAEVRKKLTHGASKLQDETNSSQVSSIGQGMEEDSGRRQDNRQPSATGKKKTSDEKQSAEPISMWA